jgi:type IV pilus assembly protein PilW
MITFTLKPKRSGIRSNERGVSLIELLVAITIGALLIFGATQVYVDSRNTYEINETMARLQETARYALSVVEPDIRMANHWGLVKGSSVITNQALRSAASAGPPTDCGTNYARDLMLSVEGSDGSDTFACADYQDDAVASADTLTVRRAAVAVSTGAGTRLRICSTRMMGTLVTDASTCTAAPAGQVNDLLVNSYYVAEDSTGRPGLPSLRRVALITGPAFADEEIIPGVEDMQVQFGVDPTGTSGIATRYVNPEDLDDGEQVVAVRIWLLVRSENEEIGFEDGRTYEYADRDADTGTTADLSASDAEGRAYVPADRFRRLLVSRTIQIRNALGT